MKLIRKLGTRLSKSGRLESWAIFWCDFCKQEVEKRLHNGLKAQSCGCIHYELTKHTKHGKVNTKVYEVLHSIRQRVLNPNNTSYKNYGGRGITVCDEWLDKDNGYANFINWALSNGYKEGLEIDRKNTNGNYEPNNCHFVTSEENCQNKRSNVITIQKAKEIRNLWNTENYTQRELAKIYSVSFQLISDIINNKIWKIK